MILGKKDPSGESKEDENKGNVLKIKIVLFTNLGIDRYHHNDCNDNTDYPTHYRKTPLAIHLTLTFRWCEDMVFGGDFVNIGVDISVYQKVKSC